MRVSPLVERSTPSSLRIGVVGCGLVAQVMHLHYLAELRDRFEVAALCDLAPDALQRGRFDADLLVELIADDDQRVTAAIGTDDHVLRRAYRVVLLDSVVHELNAVRGLLGEPTELRFADVWGDADGITSTFAFGDT